MSVTFSTPTGPFSGNQILLPHTKPSISQLSWPLMGEQAHGLTHTGSMLHLTARMLMLGNSNSNPSIIKHQYIYNIFP